MVGRKWLELVVLGEVDAIELNVNAQAQSGGA
jgi:hypothetical protein